MYSKVLNIWDYVLVMNLMICNVHLNIEGIIFEEFFFLRELRSKRSQQMYIYEKTLFSIIILPLLIFESKSVYVFSYHLSFYLFLLKYTAMKYSANFKLNCNWTIRSVCRHIRAYRPRLIYHPWGNVCSWVPIKSKFSMR